MLACGITPASDLAGREPPRSLVSPTVTDDLSGLANKIPLEHRGEEQRERGGREKRRKKLPRFYLLDWRAFIFDWLRARAQARLCLQPFAEFHVFPVRLGFPRLPQMCAPRVLLPPSRSRT